MEAYIIAQRDWDDETALKMGLKSVGASPVEAWARHIGPRPPGQREGDTSALINRWSDRGYGPRKVSIELTQQ